jgi:NADH-quinone oxidoreductase subunit H
MEAGLLFKIILVVAMFAVSLLVAMYSTFLERKVSAWMQNRKGPNRAGPLGLLQPLADGVKMFMKEEIIPNVSNKALFILAIGDIRGSIRLHHSARSNWNVRSRAA